MLALQITAAILLAFSAACFFGPQLVIYGPRALPVLMKHRQVRFVGGFLVTACAFAVMAPHFGTVLVQGGDQITLVALQIFTMDFSVI
jgi:hypothetical protein